MNILVTGAGGAAARNFVESLRLSGEELVIVGTDTRPYHLELTDLDRRYLVPGTSDPGYLQALRRLIEREHIDFVHAQPDGDVAFLSEHRAELGAATFLPAAADIELCQDKLMLAHRLADVGVPVAETYGIEDEAGLARVIATLRSRHDKVWLRARRGAGSRASLPVTSTVQGAAWVDYWAGRGLVPEDFMAAEFLPGREFAWQSLWHEGKLITSAARERVEYVFGNLMPSGQSSSPSVARTVRRADVNAAGEAAVRAVSRRPHGVYGVDMKADGEDRPRVTEINIGRFYTTSNFYAHAGLNLPAIYLTLGTGGQAPEVEQYDPLPADWYWVRMIDMGYKLVKGGQWRAREI